MRCRKVLSCLRIVLPTVFVASCVSQVLSPWPPRVGPGVHGPVNGGRVRAIAVHPGNNRHIVVATEASGLLRSTDGGYGWTPLSSLDAYVVYDVAYASRGTVLIATLGRDMTAGMGRGGVWISSDEGDHWRPVVPAGAPSGGRHEAYSIAVSLERPEVVIVGTDYGVVISTNGGRDWNAEPIRPDGSGDSLGAAVSVLPLSAGPDRMAKIQRLEFATCSQSRR